jgi:hypothetical protein
VTILELANFDTLDTCFLAESVNMGYELVYIMIWIFKFPSKALSVRTWSPADCAIAESLGDRAYWKEVRSLGWVLEGEIETPAFFLSLCFLASKTYAALFCYMLPSMMYCFTRDSKAT